jgi:hypothetical protein
VSGATGYRVYRADSSYGYYSELASTSDTSYTDAGLSSNTSYYYKVSAYNSEGEGERSYYTSATTLLPELGTLNITVGFNLGAITIAGSDGTNLIRQTTASSLVLSAEGYTGVVWYVDGDTSAPTDGNTIIINALDYPTKLHSVTFTGYKNGVLFSQTIPFTVLE